MAAITNFGDKASTALALFAKTPGYSPVKTRLAQEIGKTQAEAFYRRCLQAATEMADLVKERSDGAVAPYWAVAEQDALQHELWQHFPTLWTGPGCLGRRLHTVSRLLLTRHARVVLLGTDSPQLEPALILVSLDQAWMAVFICLVVHDVCPPPSGSPPRTASKIPWRN